MDELIKLDASVKYATSEGLTKLTAMRVYSIPISARVVGRHNDGLTTIYISINDEISFIRTKMKKILTDIRGVT